ncbi:hypothetical protein [Marinilabilia salmonicolor]|uniref:hypothetical protein n=1 Tax=Marinilabilia salmonicolor TaxID=989 RepID=UPI0002F08B94|nr:hypothetical protein [Marinilabilia salmonicolor]
MLFIIICIASFVACNIEPGKHETSDSKTVSQLDTVWNEVAPFKKKHDILDTDTVLIGTSDSMMQKYNASLEKLDGIIHRIVGIVKHYDKQPIYWVEVDRQGTQMLLLELNNKPLTYAYTGRSPEYRIDYLNPYIDCSGKQILKIRAFSPEVFPFESSTSPIKLRIGYGADKRKSDATPEYLTEVITLPQYVLDNGTQYWDTTITFQAQVPWNHSHRLENAVDLRTLPDLEERVLRKYEEIRQYFVNCDISGEIKFSENRIPYYNEVLYKATLNDIKEGINEGRLTFKPNHPDKKVFPISNYELVMYKDGKIALLRGIYDKTAVIKLIKYDPEVYPEPYEVKWHVFFYMPEGETELQVY